MKDKIDLVINVSCSISLWQAIKMRISGKVMAEFINDLNSRISKDIKNEQASLTLPNQ